MVFETMVKSITKKHTKMKLDKEHKAYKKLKPPF